MLRCCDYVYIAQRSNLETLCWLFGPGLYAKLRSKIKSRTQPGVASPLFHCFERPNPNPGLYIPYFFVSYNNACMPLLL